MYHSTSCTLLVHIANRCGKGQARVFAVIAVAADAEAATKANTKVDTEAEAEAPSLLLTANLMLLPSATAAMAAGLMSERSTPWRE